MGRETGIEWTTATWNPIRGCSRVSPGCVNCYAEVDAHRVNLRFAGMGKPQPYDGLVKLSAKGDPRWTGKVAMVPNHLDDPLRWTKPQRIFVNSMSDLFHEELSNEEIAGLFGIMAASPKHTFQILTKRAERMNEWFRWASNNGSFYRPGEAPLNVVRTMIAHARRLLGFHDVKLPKLLQGSWIGPDEWPLPNVWLGVSAEDQERADERIPHLLACPAAVRWISYEPAVGPLRMREEWVRGAFIECPIEGKKELGLEGDVDDPCAGCAGYGPECGAIRGPRLNWVVVGGESSQFGRTARQFDIQWARNVIKDCHETETKVFVKQLGERPWWNGMGKQPPIHIRTEEALFEPTGDVGFSYNGMGSRKGGDEEDWPADIRVREYPKEMLGG